MIKLKFKNLFLFILISFLFLSFIQSYNKPKIVINNLSSINISFKLNDGNVVEFNYNEYQIMLKLLFQDLNIYPSEINEEYLKVIKENKEFLDNEYNLFLNFFINYLKSNNKFKYSEEKLKDKEYIKKRLYLIISNLVSLNLPLYYLQLIDKPTNEKELVDYNTLFNSNKPLNDLQNYLLNTLKKLKKIKKIQDFFDLYTYTFNQKLDKLNLEGKTRSFLDILGLKASKDINIYISFVNDFATYGIDDDLKLQYIYGYEDVNDNVRLDHDFVGVAKNISSLFKTTSITLFPHILTSYGCLEIEDQFDIIYFHELTHLFQNAYIGGYYPSYYLFRDPKKITEITNLLYFFSFLNKKLALHEFDAYFTSIYVFNKLKGNISYKTNDKSRIDFLLLFKYLLIEYLDFSKLNNLTILFNVQQNNNEIYNNLKAFFKYYYQFRIYKSRKISKFIKNIDIFEDNILLYAL